MYVKSRLQLFYIMSLLPVDMDPQIIQMLYVCHKPKQLFRNSVGGYESTLCKWMLFVPEVTLKWQVKSYRRIRTVHFEIIQHLWVMGCYGTFDFKLQGTERDIANTSLPGQFCRCNTSLVPYGMIRLILWLNIIYQRPVVSYVSCIAKPYSVNPACYHRFEQCYHSCTILLPCIHSGSKKRLFARIIWDW